MTFLQAVLLGWLQGFTEILPLSSSGHLVLAKALLHNGPAGDLTFRMVAHLGTLLSVLVVFRDDILRIALAVTEGLRHPRKLPEVYSRTPMFRLAVFLLLGCIPVGIAGLRYDEMVSPAFSDPKMVSDFMLVTGLLIFLTRYAKPVEGKQLGLFSTIGIGLVQALAVIPGISRSGSTISAGLIAGLSGREAARFSLLMSLLVVVGATILRAGRILPAPFSINQLGILLTGVLVAAIGGYVALRLLLALLGTGKFHYLSLYCFIIGILGILFIE